MQAKVETEKSGSSLKAGASAKLQNSTEAKVEMGTPGFLPVGAKVANKTSLTGEVHVGAETGKETSTANSVQSSVTGGYSESDKKATSREIAKSLAKTLSVQESSQLGATLGKEFGVSEGNKAGLTDTREQSAGVGTTTNLSTYMVRDLMQNDSRFQTGDNKTDAARAAAWIGQNSEGAQQYVKEAQQRFLDSHELAGKVNPVLDKNADKLEKKQNEGLPAEKIEELQDKTDKVEKDATRLTAKAPGVPPENKPAPPAKGNSRPVKTAPSAPPPVPPQTTQEKVEKLAQVGKKVAEDQQLMPRIASAPQTPAQTSKDVNMPGLGDATKKQPGISVPKLNLPKAVGIKGY